MLSHRRRRYYLHRLWLFYFTTVNMFLEMYSYEILHLIFHRCTCEHKPSGLYFNDVSVSFEAKGTRGLVLSVLIVLGLVSNVTYIKQGAFTLCSKRLCVTSRVYICCAPVRAWSLYPFSWNCSGSYFRVHKATNKLAWCGVKYLLWMIKPTNISRCLVKRRITIMLLALMKQQIAGSSSYL